MVNIIVQTPSRLSAVKERHGRLTLAGPHDEGRVLGGGMGAQILSPRAFSCPSGAHQITGTINCPDRFFPGAAAERSGLHAAGCNTSNLQICRLGHERAEAELQVFPSNGVDSLQGGV